MKMFFMIQTGLKMSIAWVLSGSLFLQAADNHITVTNVSMPSRPAVSMSAAIYLDVYNGGVRDIELTGVSTGVAGHAMIHRSIEEKGVSKMQHQTQVIVPAGQKLSFEPGNLHIMLMGLDKKGINKPFEVTLVFRRHEKVTFVVKPEASINPS